MYGKTSGTLHGAGAGPARAAALYRQVLSAARGLLVLLPGRAARVLELAELADPGEEQARELAGWADPRATAYFFRSGPAVAGPPHTLPAGGRNAPSRTSWAGSARPGPDAGTVCRLTCGRSK